MLQIYSVLKVFFCCGCCKKKFNCIWRNEAKLNIINNISTYIDSSFDINYYQNNLVTLGFLKKITFNEEQKNIFEKLEYFEKQELIDFNNNSNSININ